MACTYLAVNRALAPRKPLHQRRGLDPRDEDSDTLETVVELVRVDLTAEVDIKVLLCVWVSRSGWDTTVRT